MTKVVCCLFVFIGLYIQASYAGTKGITRIDLLCTDYIPLTDAPGVEVNTSAFRAVEILNKYKANRLKYGMIIDYSNMVTASNMDDEDLQLIFTHVGYNDVYFKPVFQESGTLLFNYGSTGYGEANFVNDTRISKYMMLLDGKNYNTVIVIPLDTQAYAVCLNDDMKEDEVENLKHELRDFMTWTEKELKKGSFHAKSEFSFEELEQMHESFDNLSYIEKNQILEKILGTGAVTATTALTIKHYAKKGLTALKASAGLAASLLLFSSSVNAEQPIAYYKTGDGILDFTSSEANAKWILYRHPELLSFYIKLQAELLK